MGIQGSETDDEAELSEGVCVCVCACMHEREDVKRRCEESMNSLIPKLHNSSLGMRLGNGLRSNLV